MNLGITTAEALDGARRLASVLRGDKEPDGTMRCWWCGTEPEALHAVTTLSDAQPRYLPQWPAGDHEHAEQQPSPEQLEQAGHETLLRIRRAAS